LNFYEKIAQAASTIVEPAIPAQIRVPNRHEVRRLRSQQNRQRQKFEEAVLKFFLKKKYPTAHKMPKPARLYRKPSVSKEALFRELAQSQQLLAGAINQANFNALTSA
jgi:hypothetical protein